MGVGSVRVLVVEQVVGGVRGGNVVHSGGVLHGIGVFLRRGLVFFVVVKFVEDFGRVFASWGKVGERGFRHMD